MDAPMLAPVAPGEKAPDFVLSSIDGMGTISLDDYRGKAPLFLALFIGLWCPFCRRAIAEMSKREPVLKRNGVETLCVVATEPDNAQLYFKYRPIKLRLAADPECSTHRAYRLPKPEPTPELMQALETVKINPDGVLPKPLPIMQAAAEITKLDGYANTERDNRDVEKQWPQLKGQFLIDRDGTVRWAHIECADEGIAGIGKFPSLDEILSAARVLA